MLIISGDEPLKLTQAERANLKTYLLEKKGFLFVDEVPGVLGGFAQSVANILTEIVPNSEFKPIPQGREVHLLYRCFYQMGGPPAGATSGTKNLSGTFVGDRLLAVHSNRNYWHYLTEALPELSEGQKAELERWGKARQAARQKWLSEVKQWEKDVKQSGKHPGRDSMPKFQEPDKPK